MVRSKRGGEWSKTREWGGVVRIKGRGEGLVRIKGGDATLAYAARVAALGNPCSSCVSYPVDKRGPWLPQGEGMGGLKCMNVMVVSETRLGLGKHADKRADNPYSPLLKPSLGALVPL